MKVHLHSLYLTKATGSQDILQQEDKNRLIFSMRVGGSHGEGKQKQGESKDQLAIKGPLNSPGEI